MVTIDQTSVNFGCRRAEHENELLPPCILVHWGSMLFPKTGIHFSASCFMVRHDVDSDLARKCARPTLSPSRVHDPPGASDRRRVRSHNGSTRVLLAAQHAALANGCGCSPRTRAKPARPGTARTKE